MLDFLHKLNLQVEHFVKMQFSLAVHLNQVVREHAELLDLYVRQDAGAQTFLHQHIMGTAERLAGRLAELRQSSAGPASAASRTPTKLTSGG